MRWLVFLAAIWIGRGAHAADPLPGWPIDWQGCQVVAVADIVGGPELEVVGGSSTELRLYSHDGFLLSEWTYPPISGSPTRLLVGELIAESPGPEILFFRSSDRFFIHTSSLELLYEIETADDPTSIARPCFADVEGDGDLEVIIANTETALPPYNIDGEFQIFHLGLASFASSTHTITRNGQPVPFFDLRVSDLDFNGIAEFSPSMMNWPFTVVDADNAPIGTFPLSGTLAEGLGNHVFADLDHDGTSEIVGSHFSSITALRGTGSFLTIPQFALGSSLEFPAVGNFDADSDLEVAFGGITPGKLKVFDPMLGEYLWSYSGPYDNFQEVTAGDLNGDGIDEVVAMSLSTPTQALTTIHAFDGATYTELPGFPHDLQFGASLWKEVQLYDLDANGDLELIFVGDGQIQVLDPPNPGAPVDRASWECLLGNAAGNGDYHFGRGPYPHYVPGDSNLDGVIDLGDVITLARMLFAGRESDCPLASEWTVDERLDLADLIAVVQHVFVFASANDPPSAGCIERPRTPLCRISPCP